MKKYRIRDKIYTKSLKFGENLMPWDVVDLIEDEDLSNWKDKITLLIDIYTSCGFTIPPKDSLKDSYNLYF